MKENFDDVSDEVSTEHIDLAARAYLLYMLGYISLVDKTAGTGVSIEYVSDA